MFVDLDGSFVGDNYPLSLAQEASFGEILVTRTHGNEDNVLFAFGT